jgi:hypothetical protein
MAGQEHPKDDCRENHGKAKQLTHGKQTPEKSDVGIGFPEEFHQKSYYTIPAEKQANHGTRSESEVFEHPEDKKQ